MIEHEDKILTINQNAYIELKSFDISNHFDDDIIILEKLNTKKPISIIYFDGEKKLFFVKRFLIDSKLKKTCVISDHKHSYLEVVSTDYLPRVEVVFVKEKGKERKKEIINLSEFIAIKGIKTQGNQLSTKKIKEINLLSPLDHTVIETEDDTNNKSDLSTGNDEGQITLNL